MAAMPLAHALVTDPSTPPERWMLFLHGILGSGANWRTFARSILAARPGWGAVLVDLRLHGESHTGFAPPHTVRAAARDVAELVASLPGPAKAEAVLAHSFGGKVAIELARDPGPAKAEAVLAHSFGGKVAIELARDVPLDHLFVVDSTPSARPDHRGSEDTQHIVDLLTQLPDAFESRAEFSSWIEARGVSRPVAMWLAMNVKPVPNTTRFVFRVDVRGVRAMLEDYFVLDAWDVLEHPPGDLWTHLVVGGASGIVDADDLAHVARCPRMTVDVIEGAGHWVHVDAPDALRDVVLRRLG